MLLRVVSGVYPSPVFGSPSHLSAPSASTLSHFQVVLASSHPLVATICLGCSYAFPVLCSLLRRRQLVRNAPFSLGRFGYAIVGTIPTHPSGSPRHSARRKGTLTELQNILTVVWIAFSIVLFCMRESAVLCSMFISPSGISSITCLLPSILLPISELSPRSSLSIPTSQSRSAVPPLRIHPLATCNLNLAATAIPVTPQSMNYASVVFAGFSSIAAVWYAVYARKHYDGPVLSVVKAGGAADQREGLGIEG